MPTEQPGSPAETSTLEQSRAEPIKVRMPESEPVGAERPWHTWAVLTLALVARAVWAAIVPVVPMSDAVAYDTFAKNLAAGKVYGWDGVTPSAYWPVGAPFMYSLVYRVFHPDTWGYGPTVAANLALGLVVVWLSMRLARRWFGPAAGVVAGVCMALWPWHIQFTTILASEMVFTALCLAGMLLWPVESRRFAGRAVLAGLAFAAASYVRPTALLIPIVLAGAGFLADWKAVPAAAKLAIVGVVMGLCLAPWAVRNQRQIGTPVLVSTNGGPNLWMGNHEGTQGIYQELPAKPEGMTEAQFHAQLGREAKAYIKAHPGPFIARTMVKAVRLWERETIGVVWNEEGLKKAGLGKLIMPLKGASEAYWLAVLAAAGTGAVMIARGAGLWKLLIHPGVLVIGYFTAIHAVFVIQDRYHFPVTPLIAGLAAVGVTKLVGAERGQKPVGRYKAERIAA